MPITAWLCSGCGGREVPLDHFEKTPCGEKVCHPDYASAVFKARAEHYAKGIVEVSHLIGCPRSYAIQNAEDHSVDPLSMNAAQTGTAWHSCMEKASVEPANTEVKLEGFIAGILVTGKTDRLRRPAIEDHKHSSDFQIKYARSEGAKPDHRAQLSLYAELCEQTNGWRPTVGRIWHHFNVSGKDALFPSEFPIWPLETVLGYHPHNGAYSVRELLSQANSVFNRSAAIQSTWNQLPLAGETMFFGQKSMCDYCGVRGVCKTAATGAPF